jgi:flagellar FliJ protein
MSGELVRNHYQFLDRLQQAIVLQNTVISEIEVQRSTAHQRLMQCEVRLTGLNRILENRRAAGALVTKRREQYLSDEFASMAYVRRKLEMGQGEFS